MSKLELTKSHFTDLREAVAETIEMGWYPMVLREPAGFSEDLHFHKFPNLTFMFQGTMTFVDGEGEKYETEAGDRILIPAEAVHMGTSDDELVFVFSTPEPIWLGDKLAYDPKELANGGST